MPDLEASIVDDLIDETLVVRPVLTTAPLSTALSYLAPPELPPGSLVEVPLGGRMVLAIQILIWQSSNQYGGVSKPLCYPKACVD